MPPFTDAMYNRSHLLLLDRVLPLSVIKLSAFKVIG